MKFPQGLFLMKLRKRWTKAARAGAVASPPSHKAHSFQPANDPQLRRLEKRFRTPVCDLASSDQLMPFTLNHYQQGALLGAAIIAGVLVAGWLLRRLLQPRVYLSRVASLLTPAEQKFFEELDTAVDGRFVILSKVRIADLVEVASPNPAARQQIFRSISGKHVDFVLAEHGSLRPVAALELDDSSHQRKDRRKRDEFVDEVFRIAEIPLLRIRAAASYDVKELARAIEKIIGGRLRD